MSIPQIKRIMTHRIKKRVRTKKKRMERIKLSVY